MSYKEIFWYGIDGIAFHHGGIAADPEITYRGVTDNSCVIVEMTMRERYTEERGSDADPWDEFEDYMRENAEEVYMLIDMARDMFTCHVA